MPEGADDSYRPSSPADARGLVQRIRDAEREDIANTPERKRGQLQGLESIVNRTLNNPTHVLPELLQNADDIGASCRRVTIHLTETALIFQNHGGPMTVGNVEALGAYTETTKRGDLDTIGHFGIGFKSVFSLTKTAFIHSGYFSFRYDRDEPTVPKPVEYSEQPVATGPAVDGTRIVLPFGDASAERIDLLRTQLNHIDALLPFLNNIEEVTASVFGEERTYRRESLAKDEFIIRGQGTERRIRLFSTSFTPDAHLLRKLEEDRGVRGLEDRAVTLDVTIAIDLDAGGEPIETDTSHLFCYFPTSPDTRLPFDIQADFSLRPDRDDILWPDGFNEALLSQVPAVFEQAFRTLQAEGVDPSRLLTLLPDPDLDRKDGRGVDTVVESILDFARTHDCVPDEAGALFAPREAVLLDDPFRQLLSGETLADMLDRPVRYPAPRLSSAAWARLHAIVPENELGVVEMLEATADSSAFVSRSHGWLTRFMAGLMREWNTEYSSSWSSELRDRRERFASALKQAPLLPVQSGHCVAYDSVEGYLSRFGPQQADDYQLFTDSPRLTLLDETFLSFLYEPPAELERAASFASSLLFDNQKLLHIEQLDSEQVVREVINPEFEGGAPSPERADKLLLFIARRPKGLPDVAKIKVQSRAGDFVTPDSLFLGAAYVDAFDSETVFSVFEGLAPISDHYLNLGELSDEEWIEALTALGVQQRIELIEQDVWESDRFVSEAKARAFLDEHGDDGRTKLHDERNVPQYNGRSDTWMKKPHPNSSNQNYRYAFINRSLPEPSRQALSQAAGEGERSADVAYWRAFLEMLESEWESYYSTMIYRRYRYSDFTSKYQVNTGECYCPSSFGKFLREQTWVPGDDDALHVPQDLFVRNDQTAGKPVTFVEPEPRPADLREFLGFQTTPGIHVIISTLQSKLETYAAPDDEIEPGTIERALRKDLVPIEDQLLDEGEITDSEARDRLAETSFIFVSNATPAFRLPTQVTWDGPRLGQHLTSIAETYADFERLFTKLGVKAEPTWEDCLAFLDSTEIVARINPEEPIGAPWGQIDTAWRRVLQETVYLSPEDREAGDDPLTTVKRAGRLPTAAETLADWSTVRYHTTDQTLLANLPRELTTQVLYPFRDNRYTDAAYTARLERLTDTQPLGSVIERRLSTEPISDDTIGTLDETYGELLVAAHSYLSAELDTFEPTAMQRLAMFTVFEVEGLACEYRVDGEVYDQPIDCFLDESNERIVISTEGKAPFALMEILARELATEPAQQPELTSLLKGAYGKSDAIFREFLADSGYSPVELPTVEPEVDTTEAEETAVVRDDVEEVAGGTDAGVDDTVEREEPTVDETAADEPAVEDTTDTEETTTPAKAEPADVTDAETNEKPADGTAAETTDTPQSSTAEADASTPSERESAASTADSDGRAERRERSRSRPNRSSPSDGSREPTPKSTGSTRSGKTESPPTRREPTPTDLPPLPSRLSSSDGEPVSSKLDTESIDVAETDPDTVPPRNSSSNGGGGGGAQQKRIGDAGERFVFGELVALVEAYFAREGELLEPFGNGRDASCRGTLDDETYTVTIADVSHDQEGYDLLLEGAQIAPETASLSIMAIGDNARSLIEVKSTNGGRDRFALSSNEYETALRYASRYIVIRVHDATGEPSIDRVFHNLPNLDQQVDDVTYRANGVTFEY